MEAAQEGVLAALPSRLHRTARQGAEEVRTGFHAQALDRSDPTLRPHTLVSFGFLPSVPICSAGFPSTFAATVVKITYGVDVADTNDRYISLIEKVLSVVVAFTPGRYLV